ncbi:MAG: hypothetical protein ACYC3X_29655 [Pirellulaceae bacterium]
MGSIACDAAGDWQTARQGREGGFHKMESLVRLAEPFICMLRHNDDWAARQQQQFMDDFHSQQFNNTQDWVNQQLLDASNQMTQAQQNNP